MIHIKSRVQRLAFENQNCFCFIVHSGYVYKTVEIKNTLQSSVSVPLPLQLLKIKNAQKGVGDVCFRDNQKNTIRIPFTFLRVSRLSSDVDVGYTRVPR